MRFTSILLAVVTVIPSIVSAKQDWRIKLAKVAVSLTNQSRPPSPGSYYFKNVQTGEMIGYNQKAYQSVFLSKKGSPMTARKYGKFMKLTPTTSNNKCFSAQWHFGRNEDWAAVLYKCSANNKHTAMKRDSGIERRAKMGPVRPDKQLWIVKPGQKKGTYNIIATDHIMDQSTKAMGPCTVKQIHDPRSTGICLLPYKPNDQGQLWTIHDKKGKLLRRDIIDDLEEDNEFADVEEFDTQFNSAMEDYSEDYPTAEDFE